MSAAINVPDTYECLTSAASNTILVSRHESEANIVTRSYTTITTECAARLSKSAAIHGYANRSTLVRRANVVRSAKHGVRNVVTIEERSDKSTQCEAWSS